MIRSLNFAKTIRSSTWRISRAMPVKRSLSNLNRVVEDVAPPKNLTTIGGYLAKRLAEAGLYHYFTVPGDFTLALLDEFIKEPGLSMVSCCNELNAGYAADGYARATGGLSMACVTYMVGGLSAINAVAGAYSDDLPLLLISGGPNTNDGHERHLIHHTIGEYEIYQQSKCYEPIVAKTFVVRHPSDAARMIDEALSVCLSQRKPVYLEIPVNLATFKIDGPTIQTNAIEYYKKLSDFAALNAAAEAIIKSIRASVKPVLVAGVKLRKGEATEEFLQLANALDCGVAIMPDAKSLFPESHPNFMGRYWGGVSSYKVAEIVESSDLILLAGPILNDYTTMGWSAMLPTDKTIIFGVDHVNLFGTRYNNVHIKDILAKVAAETPSNNTSIVNFHRYAEGFQPKEPFSPPNDEAISLRYISQVVQETLSPQTSLVIETGDSWFVGQNLKLPEGCMYHVQMQYGSIGWSVGALLGVGLAWQAARVPRRILALIGDGSFQLTAQEVSTMIRYKVKATIILINNDGYTIEVQIHDGAYNDIKMWDYAGLIKVFNNTDGNGLGLKARTCGEFVEAMKKADQHDGVSLIEVFLPRDDCTAELLEWGSRVARSNGRR
eukprot:gene10972-14736_t